LNSLSIRHAAGHRQQGQQHSIEVRVGVERAKWTDMTIKKGGKLGLAKHSEASKPARQGILRDF
jgi:hypothetical protein